MRIVKPDWRVVVVGAGAMACLLSVTAFAAEEAVVTEKKDPAQIDTSADQGLSTADHAGKMHMKKEVMTRKLTTVNAGDVYGNDGKKVGHIKGLAIDSGRNRIAYAVVEFDNLADLVDKQFAVPWKAINKKFDDADKEKVTYSMDANREQLKTAKGIDKNNWPDMAAIRTEDIQGVWKVKPYRSEGARVDDRTANKTDLANRRLQGTPVSNDSGMIVRAGDLNGHRVMDQSGDDAAKIYEVIVDANSGHVLYGLLKFDNDKGLNKDNLYAVPAEMLTISSTGKEEDKSGSAKAAPSFKVTLATSLDKVKAAPNFAEKEWPSMTSQWSETVYNAYGAKPFWNQERMKRAQ